MDEQKLQEVLEFLRSMSEAELELANLYELCAGRWPEETVWGELRVQELQHGAAALRLKALVSSEPFSYTPMRPVNMKAVDLFVTSVKATAGKVSTGAYSLKQALAAAKDIEQSVLEARYDQLLSTPKPEYRRVIEVLTSETRHHKDMLLARLAALQ